MPDQHLFPKLEGASLVSSEGCPWLALGCWGAPTCGDAFFGGWSAHALPQICLWAVTRAGGTDALSAQAGASEDAALALNGQGLFPSPKE